MRRHVVLPVHRQIGSSPERGLLQHRPPHGRNSRSWVNRVFGTTQAALNEAAHEWRTRLVDGLCYEPVPVAGSSPPANARSAIR